MREGEKEEGKRWRGKKGGISALFLLSSSLSYTQSGEVGKGGGRGEFIDSGDADEDEGVRGSVIVTVAVLVKLWFKSTPSLATATLSTSFHLYVITYLLFEIMYLLA